jgi:hypothetical protein
MTTVADFAKDTLACLQVVDIRQPVKPEDMQTVIRFLNRLGTRLEANQLSLGWANIANPSDTLPLPPEAELGVMYTLALMLAPQYGVQPMPAVVAGAENFMNDLRRDQAVQTPIQPILDAPTPDRWGPVYHANFWAG